MTIVKAGHSTDNLTYDQAMIVTAIMTTAIVSPRARAQGIEPSPHFGVLGPIILDRRGSG